MSDGDIFQNVRYFAKQRRYDVAQQWMNILSAPKRRHLTSMFDRPIIMDSLDRLLCYPGLWAGLQLGNWAKHLAAHVDDCIVNYLGYINSSYERIFFGHEDLKHLLDESTVYQLQNLTPAWGKGDRIYIQEAFRQRLIFTSIQSEEILKKLEQNILSFKGIIPSIQTFHQNMKYLTIGIKILEKFIEVKPPVAKKSDITKTKPSLFVNLSRDWFVDKAAESLQVDHEKFIAPKKRHVNLSFAQLLVAALRYFPLLSTEATLQDVGGDGEAPLVSSDYIKLLCKTAKQLGFDNEKIRRQAGDMRINYRQYEKPFARMRWRSGKPPFHSFALLYDQSFALRLFGKPFNPSIFPSTLCIQSDILRAFFNMQGEIEALDVETTGVPDLDVTMDDVEEVVEPGLSFGIRRTVPRHMRSTRTDPVARKTRHQQTKIAPEAVAKRVQTNRQKTAQLNRIDPMDTDTVKDIEQTNKDPQRQQDAIEETRLLEATIPKKVRPLDLDDDDDDGDATAIIRKKPDPHPAKKIKSHTSGPIELNLNTERNFNFGQIVNRFEGSPPTEALGPPINNPIEARMQTASTEQITSTEPTIQAALNTENASQEIRRPAVESFVSQEGDLDIPPIKTNGIEPLGYEEEEQY